MTSPPLNKQSEILRLLDEGQVMVHLDPRCDGVQVPGHLAVDPVLRLNIAYGFNLPSLEVDDEGLYAVLSFGGRDFGCWIPWESVFALTLPDRDHQGSLWPEAMPAEMDPLFSSVRHLEPSDPGASSLKSVKPPALSVIDGGTQARVIPMEDSPEDDSADSADSPEDDSPEDDSADSDGPGDDPPPTGGSHLRLVKG